MTADIWVLSMLSGIAGGLALIAIYDRVTCWWQARQAEQARRRMHLFYMQLSATDRAAWDQVAQQVSTMGWSAADVARTLQQFCTGDSA